MLNVRIVVESLVEQGFLALKYTSRVLFPKTNGQANPIRKEIIEKGRSSSFVQNSIASTRGGTGVVSNSVADRLRPATTRLVQSLVRKVSSPLWAESKRRATKRLIFGETAPFFALVGVTLVSSSERGILTKSDEVEALCGNIRKAISKVGWLHNPEFWEEYHENDSLNLSNSSSGGDPDHQSFQGHVFSLADLQLGDVIDKGCNAVVYAAKWKEETINEIKCEELPMNDVIEEDEESSEVYSCSSNLLNETNEMNLTDDVEEYYSASDENIGMKRSVSDYLVTSGGDLGYRSRAASLTEDFTKYLADKNFPISQNRLKRAKFKLLSANDDDSDTDSEDYVKARSVKPKKKVKRMLSEATILEEHANNYPLAVKMMFNYEAESNAPAILSAMYKELIPAKNIQLDETLNLWKDRFMSKMTSLPVHANIVEMPCVFVDRVPSLNGSMELYPQALPSRLNPEGFGRNMSLFCVMRRYDISLSEYISQHTPSPHTALLLLTQLFEAILHISSHNIAHRDIKSDNILLLLNDGWEYPLLVLSDFGCCLADQSLHLQAPFASFESDPRQGNAALMAPEVKNASPGVMSRVNYEKADLWAAGTIAYELFGLENPFMSPYKGRKPMLDSVAYKDSQLPRLPKDIEGPIRRLVHDILRRNPKNRPTPRIAATLCQLILWAPSKWLDRYALTLPSHKEISQWLLCLTTKVLCEAKLTPSSTKSKGNEGSRSSNNYGSGLIEYQLVSTLLTRIRYSDIIQAIRWNKSF